MLRFFLQIVQQYQDPLTDGGFSYQMIILAIIFGVFIFGYFGIKWLKYKTSKNDESNISIYIELLRKIIYDQKSNENIAKQDKLKAENEIVEQRVQADKLAKEKLESEQVVLTLKEEQRTSKLSEKITLALAKNKQPIVNEIDPILKTFVENEEQVIFIESRHNPNHAVKRIGYKPNTQFIQGLDYVYPYVKMPPIGSIIKFPRKGRSNKVGYKEPVLFDALKNQIGELYQVLNDRHVPTSSNSRPYEPDLVLINEKDGKNIFINIEIDEPYEAFSRTPTHEIGSDYSRDEFFSARGWIVIRFTEKQVHEKLQLCVNFIKKVIASIDNDFLLNNNFNEQIQLSTEIQWDEIQAKKWAKEMYREIYLGIRNFGVRPNTRYEYVISNSEIDLQVEKSIKKLNSPKVENSEKDALSTKNVEKRDERIAFDPKEHKYLIDGNPDTISVTELISKFFPSFDSDYWSQYKANQRGVDQSVVLAEWEAKRVSSAEAGTLLHKQIENYFNGLPYNSDLPEFKYFLAFVDRYKNMKPYRSEWRIFDEDLLVAGTVDMVFQKEVNELYMFDWKRSEKVVDQNGGIIDSTWDFAFGELCHLGDSSYNKYALQQNIYKHILEKRYGKKITSMNLLILHPDLKTYHMLKLPELSKEVKYIFEIAKNYR